MCVAERSSPDATDHAPPPPWPPPQVSDIAIAVREGADAVMLSGETAYGRYPHKTVQVQATVALRTEMSMMRYQVGGVGWGGVGGWGWGVGYGVVKFVAVCLPTTILHLTALCSFHSRAPGGLDQRRPPPSTGWCRQTGAPTRTRTRR